MATKQNFEKLLSSPNVQKMLDLIANAEGVEHGYNTLFGNEKFSNFSSHPNISKQFTQTDGKKNNTTAAGRYQFLKSTWDGVAKKLGLEDFSPKNQDIAAVALLAQNGSLSDVLKGDFQSAVKKSGTTWASLPSSPYAQPKKTWDEISVKNPARDDYKSQASNIVKLYRQKQAEAVKTNQPNPNAENNRAQKIIAAYKSANPSKTQPQGLPDFDQNGVITYDQAPQTETPDRTLTDSIKGLGEAGLTTLTGATTGALGMIGGTATQAAREIAGGNFGTPEAANRIANNAASTASDYTYAPRTQAGQDYVQTIGEITEPLAALTPATAELGLAAQAARGAAPQAAVAAQRTAQAVAPVVEHTGQAIQRPVQATANAIKSGVDNLKYAVGLSRAPDEAAPANMGAAQVDQATVRQSLAQDLPYKPELTQGQLSRDPSQLKFEVETSKDAELGAPIRQRYEDQHQVMQQNIDAFIDSTGAKSTNMRDTGIAVDKALQKQMQIDKTKVRVAYAKADKSEEAQTPVDLNQPIQVGGREPTTVIDYLNSQPDLPTTPILTSAKKTAESIGIAKRDENGNLVAGNPTIKQMEEWRSQINHNVNAEAPNIRQAAILKDMIDRHVEPYQGTLYKAARLERKRVAEHWENRKIITDLTTNKTGSDDRKVALEDIQKRIIHDGSLDDMRFAKRALLTAGEEGKQAWKDIQGQTLQEIKDAATANVAPDAKGNQMISPAALNKAINKLDKDGKLDYIFGQKGAEQLRAVNEISKTLFTVPASAAINHSNTATVLAALIDGSILGSTGLPLPVANALKYATKHIKDNKVRARVNQALNPSQKSNKF
ncbi:glycoside hydrolase family 24 protein [Acinetobacter ursingii]|uniref:glycoside hydrolase family 24 protein n=1 Tax=Acinetobacter ursingii TaxID=108980 RepID=UPI0032B33C90